MPEWIEIYFRDEIMPGALEVRRKISIEIQGGPFMVREFTGMLEHLIKFAKAVLGGGEKSDG